MVATLPLFPGSSPATRKSNWRRSSPRPGRQHQATILPIPVRHFATTRRCGSCPPLQVGENLGERSAALFTLATIEFFLADSRLQRVILGSVNCRNETSQEVSRFI